MKIQTFFIAIVLLGLALVSCDEEIDIWDSEVIDYSGRYVVQLQSEDQSTVHLDYGDGLEIDIYNSAANISSQIWLDDFHGEIALKNKMDISGTPELFASHSLDYDKLHENVSALSVPKTPPTGLGQTTTKEDEYIKSGIIEAKVLLNAATSIGGNTADSVFIKVKLLVGDILYKSYLLPAAERDDPDVEQFAWVFDSMTYDSSLDEVAVISGHRYTGYEEDHY